LVIHLTEKYRERQTGSPATPAASEQHSVRKLDRMLDFIDASLSEHLTLDNLAQRVGVSRAHFARRFRDLTGMSPHRYLMNRRVEKAKKLLKETRISLANIALEVGFSNQAHFSAAFHAMTGLTPSHYRLDDMPLKSATCQRSN
jgi:AraC family transcriptional regulator